MTLPTKEEIAEKHENIIDRGLRHVLSTEEGRAWYFNLVGVCGVFRSELVESNVMYFEAGKKNLGIRLLGEAEILDKDLFLKMQIENTNRKKELDNVPSTSNTNITTNNTTKYSGSVDTERLV